MQLLLLGFVSVLRRRKSNCCFTTGTLAKGQASIRLEYCTDVGRKMDTPMYALHVRRYGQEVLLR